MNCPHCQTHNPDAARFCMNCGTALVPMEKAPPAAAHAVPKSAYLDQYLPGELIAKLEAARARQAMIGERRVITMLFCDVKGSTAAAEQVDPEIWTDIVNGVFERMIRPIYKYEGLVPRLMGDAILAFFGAPIAHEDDPQRALLAALEIQAGIKPYVEEIRRKHGLELGLRVGVNTGLVVVGEIGSDLRMEYTAIGDAINLAARMEQTAAVGTIQISEDTYKLVAPFFELDPLGEIEVKGKAAPVNAYRVLGVRAKPGQLRGLEGLTSPLVGREAPIALLKDGLAQLAKGTGAFVTIIGEAGLGKSSLVAEVMQTYGQHEFTWLQGDSLSYTRSTSYFPWRQILRQSIGAQEDDAPAEVRRRLDFTLDSPGVTGGDSPFLEALLAVESQESQQIVAGYQGEALLHRIADATRRFLSTLAAKDPLVVVFEDLHWVDEASLNLLSDLADVVNSQPVMIVALLRPEKTAPIWAALEKLQNATGLSYRSIWLDPLYAEQMDALLRNLLGKQELPVELHKLIVVKADGNPFFVEEIIRSLIESGQMVHENGIWQLAHEETKFSLPNTLRGVLNTRIDRLPDTTRFVLQYAAVIGRSFETSILSRLTHLNGGLEAHLQYLREASLIEPAGNAHAFRHILIQEAAYDSILLKKRAALHQQIGETLEELHAGRTEEFATLLAHHFHAAGDSRSLEYDILAGEKAARLYANAEAAAHFRRALAVARQNAAPADQIAQLFSQLGTALQMSDRYEQALQVYDEMRQFGREHEKPSIELTALMAKATMVSIFSRLHDPGLSEQILVEALEISSSIGDRATQARLYWNRMLNALFSKRFKEALHHGGHALELARMTEDREQLAFVLNDHCRLYTCLGRFEEAVHAIQEARQLWQELDHQVMLADSYGAEAEAHFNSGKFDLALQCGRQALQLSEKTNNLWGQSYDRMLISFVLLERGQLGEGIQYAEQSIQIADQAGLIASSLALRSELALVYASCGAFEPGFALIEQALEVADTRQPAWRAFAQAGKIRMHLLHNDVRSAEQTAGNALLQPISIPYARYTIFLCLANIQLAYHRREFLQALRLLDDLLEEVSPLTRVDIPEVLFWKGEVLLALERDIQAQEALLQAESLGAALGSNSQLWPIYARLAVANARLGKHQEADLNRQQARKIALQVADSLQPVGLRSSFLEQSHLKELLH